MASIIIIALLISIIGYLYIGIFLSKKLTNVADLLPLKTGTLSHVNNSKEFSASTIATSISLATVILAYFELAPYLGFWLFWTVITTSLGIFVVRLAAKRIWQKLQVYDHRPSLHEFLGTQFNSQTVSLVGAICTSLGFLGAYAVELIVGAKFIAWLLPSYPTILIIIILASVGFIYTSAGGFRAVIITDQIQMLSIWSTLIAIPIFYVIYMLSHGGLTVVLAKLPADITNLSWRPGLTSFLIGIFVINVPTFISDMSVWQRIAGSEKPTTVTNGLWSSVIGSFITWGLFVLIACYSFMIISPQDTINPLATLLIWIGKYGGYIGLLVLFFSILGLYGANLSTASTQLIAVSHTIYEDIISRFRKIPLEKRLISKNELTLSRFILVSSTIGSVLLVVVLLELGFSIADLVFSVYGAQLCLFPPIIMALFGTKDTLKKLSSFAILSLIFGFIIGWGTAIYGKIIGDGDLIFLAPLTSLLTSSTIIGIGFLKNKFLTQA